MFKNNSGIILFGLGWKLIVCKHVHDSQDQSFSSVLLLAPVTANFQHLYEKFHNKTRFKSNRNAYWGVYSRILSTKITEVKDLPSWGTHSCRHFWKSESYINSWKKLKICGVFKKQLHMLSYLKKFNESILASKSDSTTVGRKWGVHQIWCVLNFSIAFIRVVRIYRPLIAIFTI